MVWMNSWIEVPATPLGFTYPAGTESSPEMRPGLEGSLPSAPPLTLSVDMAKLVHWVKLVSSLCMTLNCPAPPGPVHLVLQM